MKPVLVDTGFLVAIYDKHDGSHTDCMRIYESLDCSLATCEPVIAEALHLLQFVRGAAENVLASVAERIVDIPFNLAESVVQVQKIMVKYRDIPADFADACLIHMADVVDTGDILTLDSNFRHYRWRRNRSFHLMIPLD